VSSIATFAIVASAAWIGVGLTGIVMAIVVGATIRLLLVLFQALKISRLLKGGITIRQGLSHVGLLINFCLPTALISLGLGYVMWFGNYTLSQLKGGLGELAVLNTAVQWRSPVLIVSEALATALLPVIGRSLGKGDSMGARHLHLSNLALNVCVALVSCAGIILLAQPILSLYGDDFVKEEQIFILFILPLVLIVYCQATEQKLVAAGRMWLMLWLYLPLFVIIVVGISLLGDQLNGVRLAYIHLIGWSALSVALTIRSFGNSSKPKTAI
jgi:O-antigen/teichoic acid export membrane protein